VGIFLAFLNFDPEVVFELGELQFCSGDGVSFGPLECFSLEGSQGGIVELPGISDGALFSLTMGGVNELIVRGENAGTGRVHLFGGPGDDILVNRLVDEHGPGVFAEVVGSSGDPSGEARVVGIDKGRSIICNDGVD
jgi:hypothetical protein